ncbi:MAG: hypothetical protein WDO19_32585 [Bacteroidota bacterium]
MPLTQSPYILYSDGKGNIFEDTSLYVTGRSGWDAVPVPDNEWIELPDGGQLYELPGRRGIGIDVKTGEMRLCEKGWAVAAFIPLPIQDFISPHTKHRRMRRYFLCFVIPQQVGSIKNFLFPHCVLKKTYARIAKDMIRKK